MCCQVSSPGSLACGVKRLVCHYFLQLDSMSQKPLLILCLGNEIISDDGFGPKVAEILQKSSEITDVVDVIFAPVAGFSLLDYLAHREKVLIVDTIRTEVDVPGTLRQVSANTFVPTNHLTTSHQINMPTALELGKLLGIPMPKVIDVISVEAEDVETLSEKLTPRVEQAIKGALHLISEWVKHNSREEMNCER
jgi:hydrogenase maturation protease